MNEDITRNYLINDSNKLRKVETILQGLVLTKKEIEKVRKTFIDELNNGLREKPSSLLMANTYIKELPDGTEEGKFLSLDLGGTNFRILVTDFRRGEVTDAVVQNYEISEELRLGSGTPLFDYVADCICHFIKDKQLTDNKMSLGFTFSFPVTQHSLRSGTLVSWTKTYKCMDVVGKDVVQLLSEALVKKGCYNVTVNAILNDTTGTFMMGALMDKRTCIGLIIGTGSNACYLEKAERVKYWETNAHTGNEVVINVEWGAFGDNGAIDFIKTEFDVQVDENSLLVKSYTFEKYISGKYLGEVVRVVLVKLAKEGILFGGKIPNELLRPHSFPSAYISHIEGDMINGGWTDTRDLLAKLNISEYSDEDVNLIRRACWVVTNRSALLVAICLSVLLERIDKKEVTIAVDGSVYEKHPTYRYKLENYLGQMTKKEFQFLRVSDGSGKGAAVVVAIVNKLNQNFMDS